jgi:hypothetical protein
VHSEIDVGSIYEVSAKPKYRKPEEGKIGKSCARQYHPRRARITDFKRRITHLMGV